MLDDGRASVELPGVWPATSSARAVMRGIWRWERPGLAGVRAPGPPETDRTLCCFYTLIPVTVHGTYRCVHLIPANAKR